MKELQRQLGLTSIVAISISTMLGSGIFVLPGLAAAKTGTSIWLAYIVAGICVVPAAMSKAELGVAMPESGGTYVYLDRTFGPLLGTIAGLGLWLALMLKSAFALVGFTAYMAVLTDVPIKPTAIAFLVAITLLNLRGIMKVSQVQMAVVGAALLGLVGLSISGSLSYDPSRLGPFFGHGSGGFVTAVAFVFVSYAGVTKIAAIAEEVRDPNRNLPLGIIISLALVMVVYGVVNLMIVAHIPMDDLVTDIHPVYTLALNLGGPEIGTAFAVLGVLTMTSMANAGLLAASRFPFAMSRDRLLPDILHGLHSRYLTPTVSIIASAAFMGISILLFDVEKIAKLASAFVIMLFMAVNLAVIVLRETGVQWYKPKFRSPLYPGLQVFGILSGLGLLIAMGPVAILAGAAIAGPGTLLFFAYGRRRIERLGVLGQRGRRQNLLLPDSDAGAGNDSDNDDNDIRSGSKVAVTLFGSERSPELLVELGGSLANGQPMQVAFVTEIPEQTALDAVPDRRRMRSVRRRVNAVAEADQLDLRFTPISSRDIIQTAHQLTSHPDCQWLVLAWAGRSRESITVRNPLGWLKDHISCNLAIFHDAGIRLIRKILVHVEPGPHDSLVVRTAEHLARIHGARLTFVRFVPENEPLKAQSEADYLDQVHKLVAVESEVLLLRGVSESQALDDASIDYDLLVTAEPPQASMWARLRGGGHDRMTANAACSVLRVQRTRRSVHQVSETHPDDAEPEKPMRLSQLCGLSHLQIGLDLNKKEALFQHFSDVLSAGSDILNSDEIGQALWDREKTQNTAVGEGVALPHATISNAERSYVGVFTAANPVDYGAPDGQPVDVFFVTMGPPQQRNTHLALLAEISRLVVTTPLLSKMRTATSSQDLADALVECEKLRP